MPKAPRMVCTVIDGVCVVSHTAESPSDDEWDHYLDLMGRHLAVLQAIFVVTEGGAPDGKQRGAVAKFWERNGLVVPAAVLTPSPFVRALVNTLGWMVGNRIQAFRRDEHDAAFDYLRLEPHQRSAVIKAVTELARALRA